MLILIKDEMRMRAYPLDQTDFRYNLKQLMALFDVLLPFFFILFYLLIPLLQ